CRLFSSSLYGDGAPRNLQSFPTRRSSDLLTTEKPYRNIDGQFRTRHQTHRSRDGQEVLRPQSGPDRLALYRQELSALLFRAGSRDRKSTRLNSSHVKISYAVFCLKKKTNN